MHLRINLSEPRFRVAEHPLHVRLTGAEHEIFSRLIRHVARKNGGQPLRIFHSHARASMRRPVQRIRTDRIKTLPAPAESDRWPAQAEFPRMTASPNDIPLTAQPSDSTIKRRNSLRAYSFSHFFIILTTVMDVNGCFPGAAGAHCRTATHLGQ